jgi:hypothetical protein
MNAAARALPAGITATQSYSWVLREQMIAAVLPLFPGFKLFRTSQVPIQTRDLPALGVYLLPERMTPDGELNAGTIRFTHNFTIGFSVCIANNDPDIAEQKLDAAWWLLMHGLWCTDWFTNMLGNGNPDNTALEGIAQAVRRVSYGSIGSNQETPVAELQYEVTGVYRTGWAPTDFPDLLEIAVQALPSGEDPTQTESIDVRYLWPSPFSLDQIVTSTIPSKPSGETK